MRGAGGENGTEGYDALYSASVLVHTVFCGAWKNEPRRGEGFRELECDTKLPELKAHKRLFRAQKMRNCRLRMMKGT